jgi:L-2-hydroxyglutarate oxidase LhgO
LCTSAEEFVAVAENGVVAAERRDDFVPRLATTLRHVVRTASVVVVGAGILGLAVARELLQRRPKLDLVVLEKEDAVGRHQTGHNSGVIHSGIYYAPGSLKAQLCTEGRELMFRYCDERGIDYERCGKVVVATSPNELPRLAELHRRAVANGVDVEELEPERLAELEPHVAGIKALHTPVTGIVDFRRVVLALAEDVRGAGGAVRTGEEVTDLRPDGGGTVVETANRRLRARAVVTCAGLHSDRLAVLTGAPESPKIVPFRGSYHVLRPEARALVNRLVYPVVDPNLPFLGVHFTKQISGDVWVGPNAVLAFAREGYRLGNVRLADLREIFGYKGFRALAKRYWRSGLDELAGELSKRRLVRDLRKLVPELRAADILPGPSGVRAQALSEDGRLLDDFWFDELGSVTHVRNAPSPGATSSLAIARVIVDRVERSLTA